jgi:hypothetical protein
VVYGSAPITLNGTVSASGTPTGQTALPKNKGGHDGRRVKYSATIEAEINRRREEQPIRTEIPQ